MFATIATGQVNDKDVERIARKNATVDIEDVAGRPHILDRLHPKAVAIDGSKRHWKKQPAVCYQNSS